MAAADVDTEAVKAVESALSTAFNAFAQQAEGTVDPLRFIAANLEAQATQKNAAAAVPSQGSSGASVITAASPSAPRMRLLTAGATPFGRKVLIALHETGQLEHADVQQVKLSPMAPGTVVPPLNPLGRIPTLELADGSALHDSNVITRFVDARASPGRKIYPTGDGLWPALTLEALGDGMMEASLHLVFEARLQTDGWGAHAPRRNWEDSLWLKIQRSLDALEAKAAAGTDGFRLAGGGRLHMGHFSIATALGYIDFRLAGKGEPRADWRQGRPRLAAWEAEVASRESFLASAPADGQPSTAASVAADAPSAVAAAPREALVRRASAGIDRVLRTRLQTMHVFVLDNSLREPSVAATYGHTAADKHAIMRCVKEVGFSEIIVAALNRHNQLDDKFCRQLQASGVDLSRCWSFAEYADDRPALHDDSHVPIGLRKARDLGLRNIVIELDAADPEIEWCDGTGDTKAAADAAMARYVEGLIWLLTWMRTHLGAASRAMVNIRDLSVAMVQAPHRVLSLVAAVARISADLRPIALLFEEPLGEYFPGEVGGWTQRVRDTMDANGWESRFQASGGTSSF